MRTRPSCKRWRRKVSRRGATVGPGHLYLYSTEMASLEAATDTAGLTRQGSEMVMIYSVVANKEVKLLSFCVKSNFSLLYKSKCYIHAGSKMALSSVVRMYQCLLTFQPQLNRERYLAWKIHGHYMSKQMKSEGLLLVHLPSVHEWRDNSCLTFSQSGRIGNVKSLWKAGLVEDNGGITIVVKGNHHIKY